MEYPFYLVPQCEDGTINVIEQLDKICFARRAKRPGSIVDTSGTRVTQDAILGPGESGQMKDLSINLLGQHTKNDCYIMITKSDIPYSDLWNLGTPGICPKESEVSLLSSEEFGIVYFMFARKDIPFPISETDHDCSATICHRPTNCNYWHFQLEVTLSNGDSLPANPEWKKRLLKRMLGILVEAWASTSPSDCSDSTIPLTYRIAAQRSA